MSSAGQSLDGARLAALAAKYRTLARLRRERDQGGPSTSGATPEQKAQWRELATAYPGALRELDTFSEAELRDRAAQLTAATSGGPIAGWMVAIDGFHRYLEAALALKRQLASSDAPVDDGRAHQLAAELNARFGPVLDAPFVAELASPAGGRLVPVILTRLARSLGITPEELRRCLFPTRRRP